MKSFRLYTSSEDLLKEQPENVLQATDAVFEMTEKKWANASNLFFIAVFGVLAIAFAVSAYINLSLGLVRSWNDLMMIQAEHSDTFYEDIIAPPIFLCLFFVFLILSRSIIVYIKCDRDSLVIQKRSEKSSGSFGHTIRPNRMEAITVFTSQHKGTTTVALAFKTPEGKNVLYDFRSDVFGQSGLAWLERWLRQHFKAVTPS